MTRKLRTLAQGGAATIDLVFPRLVGPRILIYHQVGSGRDHEMNVATSSFERQLDWLASHGEIVTLEDAIRRRGEPDSERLFVLSFDDGYADVFANAFPLLAAMSLPFTLYLTTGPIEEPDAYPDWPGVPLAWSEIRQMSDSGLATIGAHTHSHPDLRWVSREVARNEIDHSNALLRRRLDIEARHFTYPKGWWSAHADPEIRRAYDTATLGMGTAVTPEADLHALGRVSVVASDPFWAFRAKMTCGGRTEARLRRMRHRYAGP